MHPVAFHIFGMPIHFYGILIGIGFLVAAQTCQFKRAYANLTEDQIINITILSMIAGVVGARLNFIITYHDEFIGKPFSEYFAVWNGGLVFYGGFVCVLIFLLLYCRLKKFSILRVFDLFAMALPLGHAFGRIGCFMAGCCFGAPTQCACSVTYPNTIVGLNPVTQQPVYTYEEIFRTFHDFPALIPIQLIEAVVNVVIFIILFKLIGKRRVGQISALYMILYGTARFILEYFRGDYPGHGLFTPGQIMGLWIVPLGLVIFAAAEYFGRKNSQTPPLEPTK